VGEKAENPTKNQGEIQGSRKTSVLVGFLRQKNGLCIHPLEEEEEAELLPERRTDSRQLRLNHASFVFDCDRMGWLNNIIRKTSTLHATLSRKN
jgi:hypothetical protein